MGPIFICGTGRSGTSLLSVILDSHHNIVMGAEYPLYLNHGFTVSDLRRGKAKQSLNRAERCGLTASEVRVAFKGLPSEFPADRSEVLTALGEALARKTGKPRWGVKIMLDSARIGVYASAFPDASFIHLVRDPRDCFASERAFGWGERNAASSARNWVALNRAVISHPGAIGVLYEDLVASPREVMDLVLQRLGEPWDDNVLRHESMPHLFHSMDRVKHPSRESTKRSVNQSAVGRWKTDLRGPEVHAIEEVAGELMRECGYS